MASGAMGDFTAGPNIRVLSVALTASIESRKISDSIRCGRRRQSRRVSGSIVAASRESAAGCAPADESRGCLEMAALCRDTATVQSLEIDRARHDEALQRF